METHATLPQFEAGTLALSFFPRACSGGVPSSWSGRHRPRPPAVTPWPHGDQASQIAGGRLVWQAVACRVLRVSGESRIVARHGGRGRPLGLGGRCLGLRWSSLPNQDKATLGLWSAAEMTYGKVAKDGGSRNAPIGCPDPALILLHMGTLGARVFRGGLILHCPPFPESSVVDCKEVC